MTEAVSREMIILDFDNQLWRYRVSGTGAGWLASGGFGNQIVVSNTGDGNPLNDLVFLQTADNKI